MNLARLIHRREILSFFRYPADAPRVDPGAAPAGCTVRRFDDAAPLPSGIAAVVFPRGRLDTMRWRYRRRLAALLVLLGAGERVVAYGWIQSWRPFRRRFRAIAAEGRMLGFYWTHPAERGRGLYSDMLRRSIAMIPAPEPLIIYAEHGNVASIRGIRTAGFEHLADLEVHRWLHVFFRCRVVTRGGGA